MGDRKDKPATIDEQVLNGQADGKEASAALFVPQKEEGPPVPQHTRTIKDISPLSELEKRKWREYEYEKKTGTGDHHFKVRIVWNFLPRHPWKTDPQYETYVEKLDWRELQYVKRHVHSGSRERVSSIKWVIPEAPGGFVRSLATKYGRNKSIAQLTEYLFDVKRQYADADESRLTAEEIVDKYEALFRDSRDVGECIRLGEMIVKYRNLDLSKGQKAELSEADEDDFKHAQGIIKSSQDLDDATDTYRPEGGGGVRESAPDSPSGASGLPPQGPTAL